MFFLLLCLHLSAWTEGIIVSLDSGGIKEIIGNSEDAWILCLEENNNKLKGFEEEHRGIFKVGVMKKNDYYLEKHDGPARSAYVIFPYGIGAKKINKPAFANTQKQALKTVLQNIPDHTVKLPNKLDAENEKLRGFFQEAYATNPTRFPIVYFTDSLETPVEMKVLSLKYSSLFLFGVIHQPNPDTQHSYTITKVPHVTAFVVDEYKKANPRIRKVPFLEQIYGPMKYSYMVRFLYLLHQNHFKDLPLSQLNKSEIDLDALFFADIQLFRDDYLRYPINIPNKNSEL